MADIDKNEYYLSRFEDQRHLLRTAIRGMADGDITQALTIAVVIRVLVHETGNQKPLLKRLKPNYLDLPILDRDMQKISAPPKDLQPGVQAITFFCPISAKMSTIEGKTTIGLVTDLNPDAYKLSTLGAWWENACMILPALGPFFRYELIVNLADKEGAHVDPRIKDRYQKVLESIFVNTQLNGENAALNVSRLVAGKCGVELLDCLDKNFPPPAAPAKP
jgi:hypothetical protein